MRSLVLVELNAKGKGETFSNWTLYGKNQQSNAHRDGLGKKSPKRPKMKVAKFEKLFYKICVHTLDYLKKS